ncbi:MULTISPECIES: DUF6069 family protein [Nocardiopsis]|uniref:Uncharacterized protein n=1 Tax=Nocardiopsis sinuspersici TaxID=501010 RepID=A0A1V3C503_9ACTN|nr:MULTISPECIES: DUF6069 family protein [Nocardiopsis]NYH52010.1 hypothetical protein [Nocardiopsis sinuspersici]OOC55569.1 hypothetical protein NOSIN_18510 [Nocardiopsis sinuspersici]
MTEIGNERPVNTTRLWSGGLATAVVAALVIFAGTLVFRGVFGIPVLAPEDAGNLGDASTVAYALMAAVAALLATGLMHLLLLSAPRALKFFGWILGLATAIAAVAPFSEAAGTPSQIATAVINLVTGIAIITLLRSVARSATLSSRSVATDPAHTARASEANVRPLGETEPMPRDETQPVDPKEPPQGEDPVLRHEGILPDVRQDEYRRNQVRAQEMDAEAERARQSRRAPGDEHAG